MTTQVYEYCDSLIESSQCLDRKAVDKNSFQFNHNLWLSTMFNKQPKSVRSEPLSEISFAGITWLLENKLP